MDKISIEKRSANMRAIRSTNTKPEMLVRRLVHSLGYRYRLHRKDLPGKPDLVFPAKKKVILVHGCFWHQHSACREGRPPKSNSSFWDAKLKRNVERDTLNVMKLTELGWKSLIVWECEIENSNDLQEKITNFLDY